MSITTHPLVWLVFIVALVRPFGNYPVNDDWQYARVAKLLMERHSLVIDTPIAPALVGQAFLGATVCWIFGFSHTLLRLVTLILAAVCWWCVDRILALADVDARVRRMAGILLVTNVLFLHLSLSFMTEMYGYAPALLGAVLWFSERRRAEEASRPTALRFAAAPAVGFVIGSSFWTRQFCVVLFPALLSATVLWLLLQGQWRRLLRTIPSMSAGSLVFTAVVAAYFPWARWTGNSREAFDEPIANILRIQASVWQIEWGSFWAYMVLFLSPLGLLAVGKHSSLRLRLCLWAILGGSIAAAGVRLRQLNKPPSTMFDFLHGQFPYLSNILHNAGVGPVTLPDVFFMGMPRPGFPNAAWWIVEGALFVGAWLLAAPLARIPRLVYRASRAGETALFGIALSMLSLFLVVQTYGLQVFDRYLLASFMGLLFVVAIAVPTGEAATDAAVDPMTPPRRPWSRFILALGPILFFAVAGVHDYFRWNDARWRLVAMLVQQGVPTGVIQGGYEVNGWLNYDQSRAHVVPTGCIGACHCRVHWAEWACIDDSYQIAMNLLPGYEPLLTERVTYWLVPSIQPLYALRRDLTYAWPRNRSFKRRSASQNRR